MKQFLLLVLLFISTVHSYAQRLFVAEKQYGVASASFPKTLTCADTLGLCNYNTAPKALYKDQLGGYAVGTNFFGDIAKAQQFDIDDTAHLNIRKVLFYFGAKTKVAPDSFLVVNIYNIDSLGFASGGVTKACPDTISASRKLYLDSIDTIAGHPTIVDFQWGVSVKGKFAVGFDMRHLGANDKVGLYSTKDSSATVSDLSWEEQSNGRWYTMKRSWPLDIDFAIFPIVDKTAIGIQEQSHSSLLNLTVTPNPSNENVRLNCLVQEAGNVVVRISSAEGKTVYQNSTYQPKGNYSLLLSTADLNAGIYSLNVQTKQYQQSKKLVVLH